MSDYINKKLTFLHLYKNLIQFFDINYDRADTSTGNVSNYYTPRHSSVRTPERYGLQVIKAL